jgi:hypothetical protein
MEEVMKNKNTITETKKIRVQLDYNFIHNTHSPYEQMIACAAYFRAEKRGFAPNHDKADWFAAEAEIDRHLTSFSS